MAKAAKKKTVTQRERPMEQHRCKESYASDLSVIFSISLVVWAARNGFMQENLIETIAVVATSIVVYGCSRAVFGLLK